MKKSVYIKRSSTDRRSPAERRVLDMGPSYLDREKREKARRRSWEDRYGWERISKWASVPIYTDLP